MKIVILIVQCVGIHVLGGLTTLGIIVLGGFEAAQGSI